MNKLKNSNCDKTKKKRDNSKAQIVTKLKKSNFDKTPKFPIVTVVPVIIVTPFSKNNFDTSTTDEMFSVQLFAILEMFLVGGGSEFSGFILLNSCKADILKLFIQPIHLPRCSPHLLPLLVEML